MASLTPLSSRALAALLVTLFVSGDALAEVFVFRDRVRGERRGKVLAEFKDALFVKLDGQPSAFVSRTELTAIVDDGGRSFEQPPLGTFAPPLEITPVAALTDVLGEAWLTTPRRPPAPAANTPMFLGERQGISTGEAAFARLVLPSGATCKLSPRSEAALPSAQRETLSLVQGEAFISSRLRPLHLPLPSPLSARLESGSEVTLRQQGDTTYIRQHEGRTVVESPSLSFVLEAGQGIQLRRLTQDSWRLSADPANADALLMRVDGKELPLEPGDSQVLGASGAQEGTLWRVRFSRGDISVRKGADGSFKHVESQERARLVLGAGDAVRTSQSSSATLVRASDGGTVSLHGGSTLELNGVLHLELGRLTIEALSRPIGLETPGGTALLSEVMVEVQRPPRSHALEAKAIAGSAEFPVGPMATVRLEKACKVRLTPGNVLAMNGRATVRSRAATPEQDPQFRVTLEEGRSLGVGREGPNALLMLPGDRVLEFMGAGVDTTVHLDDVPHCTFGAGTEVSLKEGLRLGLARADGLPLLRFVSGPRLAIAHPFKLYVENPTVILRLEPRDLSIKLEGDINVRLLGGGRHSVAALGVRDEDYLELSGEGDVRLDRFRDLTRFSYADARQLWIQDGAPPVQSRISDESGTAFLSMPGVPALGLAPARRITVLATRDGEFVILDQDAVSRETTDLELLSGAGTGAPVTTFQRDPIPDLLDVPPAVSPSGP